MTTDAEALVHRAYHLAEGNVMDVQGFIDLFADDGVLNAVGQESYRGQGDRVSPPTSRTKTARPVERLVRHSPS